MPTVTRWAEAVEIVRRLQSENRLEDKRRECAAWWHDYKPRLAGNVADFVKRALGGEA
jgi:hypothetical protein